MNKTALCMSSLIQRTKSLIAQIIFKLNFKTDALMNKTHTNLLVVTCFLKLEPLLN